MEWFYTLSGLLVGFIVGLTGVGGGSLMTPLLVMAFGISPATAVGTDLLYASITKAGGVWVHGRKKTVEWKIVGLLALGSIPASILAIFGLKALGVDSKQFSAVITTTLGVALILTAGALIFKERLLQLGRRHVAAGSDKQQPRWLTTATIATGAVLGLLVTVSSVGAGALGVVALFFLYPKLPALRIVGSDIAHAVPLTAVAGFGHFYMGTVDFSLLGSLLLGSLPGIYLGSHVAAKVPEKVLRPILASLLVLIGSKLVL